MDNRVVIRGDGYENKNIIIKKKNKGRSFAFFLLLFGAAVYLLATVLLKSLFGESVPIAAFSFAF